MGMNTPTQGTPMNTSNQNDLWLALVNLSRNSPRQQEPDRIKEK